MNHHSVKFVLAVGFCCCVVAQYSGTSTPEPPCCARFLRARHAAHPRRATAATAMTGEWTQTGQVWTRGTSWWSAGLWVACPVSRTVVRTSGAAAADPVIIGDAQHLNGQGPGPDGGGWAVAQAETTTAGRKPACIRPIRGRKGVGCTCNTPDRHQRVVPKAREWVWERVC